VNAAFLLMSSAALAGADPMPAPAAPVVVSGAGCSNCGPPVHYSDCGCSKPGLLDRFKARFGKKSHDCGCAPAPCPTPCPPPAPCPPPCAPAPCHTCKSAADRPNLFDTLKSRWGHKKSCGPTCDPCGASHLGGCATPLPADAHPVTPGTGTPPKVMPKPVDPKADPKADPKGKGNSTGAPLAPTVNGAGLTAPGSPY
jgi:hypothetical protein